MGLEFLIHKKSFSDRIENKNSPFRKLFPLLCETVVVVPVEANPEEDRLGPLSSPPPAPPLPPVDAPPFSNILLRRRAVVNPNRLHSHVTLLLTLCRGRSDSQPHREHSSDNIIHTSSRVSLLNSLQRRHFTLEIHESIFATDSTLHYTLLYTVCLSIAGSHLLRLKLFDTQQSTTTSTYTRILSSSPPNSGSNRRNLFASPAARLLLLCEPTTRGREGGTTPKQNAVD